MMGRVIGALILGLGGIAVLVSLGIWQVQRLAWKEALLADIGARIVAEPVALPASADPEADRYLPVIAQGMVGDEGLRVLVSTKQDGAGYRVISVFETDGRRVLLDRGFIDTEAPIPAGGPIEVIGNLHWPDDLNRSTPEPDVMRNIWFARDIPRMAETLGTEPLLVIAREVSPAAGPRPMPVTTEGIPNDHLGYAATWFGLAIVWFGMTLFLLWRIRRSAKPKAG